MTQTNQTTATFEVTLEQLDAIQGGQNNQSAGQVLTNVGETIVKALVAATTTVLQSI